MAKKILIVEDEILMGQMYKDKFEQAGFDVCWATTSEQAMELARKEKPDLILLDILLPTENGVSFLGKLRKEPKIGNTLVVAFSNYDDPKAEKEALELGAKDYLLKTDYTPDALVKEIKKYL